MIKWNDFRGIYRFFFWVKQAIGWLRYLCNLILTDGFNFSENLTVRSFLNRWDQSVTIGSSQDFKSGRWIKNMRCSYDHSERDRRCTEHLRCGC